MVKIGDHVVYIDPTRIERQALVTAVFSQDCINIMFASADENKQDSYGRQLERATSLPREGAWNNGAGNCWREVQ